MQYAHGYGEGGDLNEDQFWRRAVDRGSYEEKVVNSLLTELGYNLEIFARITPGPDPNYLHDLSNLTQYPDSPAKLTQLISQKPTIQQRVDNYFKDELHACQGRIRWRTSTDVLPPFEKDSGTAFFLQASLRKRKKSDENMP